MDLLILLIPSHYCFHDDGILSPKHVGWLKFIYNILHNSVVGVCWYIWMIASTIHGMSNMKYGHLTVLFLLVHFFCKMWILPLWRWGRIVHRTHKHKHMYICMYLLPWELSFACSASHIFSFLIVGISVILIIILSLTK